MTQSDRDKIQRLRLEGKSYTQIADTLQISRNTVKSVCQRMGIKQADVLVENHDSEHCRHCGRILLQNETGKRKLFCSDLCRRAWWKQHRDKIKLKSAAKAKCAFCGRVFEDYEKNHRKYCCHTCYIRDRFGEKRPYDKRAV